MQASISLLILILFSSCARNPKRQSSNVDLKANDTLESSSAADSKEPPHITSLLPDTTVVAGDFVLFLRPDSIRFQDYAKQDEHIYEADADFAFGVSATMDSLAT